MNNEEELYNNSRKSIKHPKCRGYYNEFEVFVCGYNTRILCMDCKYGNGKLDPMKNIK